jgi:hypothetical protein
VAQTFSLCFRAYMRTSFCKDRSMTVNPLLFGLYHSSFGERYCLRLKDTLLCGS